MEKRLHLTLIYLDGFELDLTSMSHYPPLALTSMTPRVASMLVCL